MSRPRDGKCDSNHLGGYNRRRMSNEDYRNWRGIGRVEPSSRLAPFDTICRKYLKQLRKMCYQRERVAV